MNDNLLEQYRRDPAETIFRLEAAARRERARVISQYLHQAAAALFGTRRSPDTQTKAVVGPKTCCSPSA